MNTQSLSQSDSEQKKSLKVEVLEKISQLVTTGFGIVAALAWNDTIKGVFERFFPKPEDNLLAMLGYALIITVLVVMATIHLGRLINIAKKRL